jgi:hypothetical protein
MEGAYRQLRDNDFSWYMVCQPRKSKSDDHPTGTSQRTARLLVKVENSHCRVESDSPSQRRDLNCRGENFTLFFEFGAGLQILHHQGAGED